LAHDTDARQRGNINRNVGTGRHGSSVIAGAADTNYACAAKAILSQIPGRAEER
jgi:hypothetical protein